MRPAATSSTSPATVVPSIERQRDARVVVAGGRDLLAEVDVPAVARLAGEALRHRLVLVAHQEPAAADDRHTGAERGEHVRELGRDVPAPDDHEVLGNLVDAHDRV